LFKSNIIIEAVVLFSFWPWLCSVFGGGCVQFLAVVVFSFWWWLCSVFGGGCVQFLAVVVFSFFWQTCQVRKVNTGGNNIYCRV